MNNESTRATAAPDLLPCPWCHKSALLVQALVNGTTQFQCADCLNLSHETVKHDYCFDCEMVHIVGDCPARPSPSTGGEPMNAAGFFAEAKRLGCKLPDALELAAREPAPVARELDVEAERREDQAEALADLRQAVKDEVSDEWLLAFIQQYPFAARQATAESAPASAAPGANP